MASSEGIQILLVREPTPAGRSTNRAGCSAALTREMSTWVTSAAPREVEHHRPICLRLNRSVSTQQSAAPLRRYERSCPGHRPGGSECEGIQNETLVVCERFDAHPARHSAQYHAQGCNSEHYHDPISKRQIRIVSIRVLSATHHERGEADANEPDNQQ